MPWKYLIRYISVRGTYFIILVECNVEHFTLKLEKFNLNGNEITTCLIHNYKYDKTRESILSLETLHGTLLIIPWHI